MLITTNAYIVDEDEWDWEPSQLKIIIHAGKAGYRRGFKLAMTPTKAKELVNLINKILGETDYGHAGKRLVHRN